MQIIINTFVIMCALGYQPGDLNFYDLRSDETKPIQKMENLHNRTDIRELQWISDHEMLTAAPDGVCVYIYVWGMCTLAVFCAI